MYPGRKRSLAVSLVGLALLVCACSPAANQRAALPEPLEIEDARELIQEYWAAANPGYTSSSGFRVTEITTPEVWESLRFQLYSLDGNYTFLIRDGRVSLFHQGVFGGGVVAMMVAPAGAGGRLALVYSSEVSLSGVYHGCVSAAYEADGGIVQVPIVAGFLQTFELERSASGEIEIFAGDNVVGRVRLRESDGQVDASILLDASLATDIREALTSSGLACGRGAAEHE